MKKYAVLVMGLLLVFVVSGCMHPLMDAKKNWARNEAVSAGYAPVQVAGQTCYIPREAAVSYLRVTTAANGAKVETMDEQSLLFDIRWGKVKAYTDEQLAKQLDPSGVWWRQVGDGTINGTVYATVVGGVVAGINAAGGGGNGRDKVEYNQTFNNGGDASGGGQGTSATGGQNGGQKPSGEGSSVTVKNTPANTKK